ncbi:protoporphyrinogen oxidase [Gottfriedia luciferensis]|uniref:protoporphyrinogen oxidase n=1 Tax=Gottfriedia luciferensis TaxID=178774 RepID=UPI000B435BF0|nr:protoporphyrinogen oxidase [Gottfriedia luciferensis]
MNKKVVIIGGGITGLTAAYYLKQEKLKNNLPIDIQLIEGSSKLGGKIQTIRKDGFVIERGPDSFLARKTSAYRLAENLGIEDKIVFNTAGKSYVLAHNKLHGMPEGSNMGIPTQIKPFVFSGLFSPAGKLRASLDFVLPKTHVEGDMSLGKFFRRRLGNEVVENLIEPLLSGIYSGDIDQMSLMATFPQFFQIEQKHQSIVLGMKKEMPVKKSKGPRKGIFQTVSTGLQTIVERIEDHLDKEEVLKGVQVVNINKIGKKYEIVLSNNETIESDSIIVTVPHRFIPEIFNNKPVFEPFKKVPSTSVANVALAFPEEAIKKDINGTGFVVSRNNDYNITACTWTHKKWPHACPKGKVLLRCYVGRPYNKEIVDKTDEELVEIVLEDLRKTMDITEKPEFYVVSRWKDAMPQYTINHKERTKKMEQYLQKEMPGVSVIGCSFYGSGLPDCIDQGEKAVSDTIEFLFSNEKQAVPNS